ncbi:unnamed protein product [Bursaphelenchus xylophilus]|uniref:(pine wood nematode) hypothetical protein n=1 Tax=Bursaphelenchus xylophilus TaxID=6326 RepID=A0A1I7RU68_BURXY|nr:unnamed protein product [Bursaphelenchus xylophilus]CAG9113871.1 unnamed protein product [Bursaphelenchus xylophilus]
MTEQLAAHLLNAAKVVEQKLDAELDRLDQLDDDEMEEIRRKRLAELRKAQDKKAELVSSGHGKLTELGNERDFFEARKKTSKMVCYFYGQQTEKHQAVEKVLNNLAQQHFFTRFTCLNAERSPFLVERLNLKIFPVIAVITGDKVGDYIRLADKLNDTVESLEHYIETRLFEAGVITECRSQPPKQQKSKTIFGMAPLKRGIRGGRHDESDDEDY